MKKLNCFVMAAIASLVVLFSQSAMAQIENKSSDKIYKSSELTKQASYAGGIEALAHFLSSNLSYPKEALAAGVEGVMKVSFVVEPDGRVTNPKVLNDPGYGCAHVAEHIVVKMENWTSGELNGRKVRSEVVIDFPFSLPQNR